MKTRTTQFLIAGILFALTWIGMLIPWTAAATLPTEPKLQNFPDARKLEEHEFDDNFRFGVGYSSYGTLSTTGIPGGLSAVLDINPTHAVQVFFGINQVRESFDFGTGTLYRATLSGDRLLGFHAGALVNLGSDQGSFFAKLGPILGIHVAVFQLPQLQLSVEGGPLFTYQNTHPDLTLSPLSAGFGLNLHYFF